MNRLSKSINLAALILGLAGSILAISITAMSWFPNLDRNSGQLGVKFLGSTCLILLVATVWQEYRYARKARYGEILPFIQQIAAELLKHKPAGHIDQLDEVDAVLRLVVNRLSSTFSLITGTKCSVCLKAVTAPTHRPEAMRAISVCRDDTSQDRETMVSATEGIASELAGNYPVEHLLLLNTIYRNALERPWSAHGRCFFSNHLPSVWSFESTSFQIYGTPSKSRWTLVRDVQWPLPYKSIMVSPICRQRNLEMMPEIVGYLVVDSRSRNVFKKSYDLDLVIGIADMLYTHMDKYRKLITEKLSREAGGFGHEN